MRSPQRYFRGPLAIGAVAVLAAYAAHALRPWVDEGWHGAPAWSLACRGYMGTPCFAEDGLKDIHRYTYWIMPIYPVAQAVWYRLSQFQSGVHARAAGFLRIAWIARLDAGFPPPDRGHFRRVAVHGLDGVRLYQPERRGYRPSGRDGLRLSGWGVCRISSLAGEEPAPGYSAQPNPGGRQRPHPPEWRHAFVSGRPLAGGLFRIAATSGRLM